MSRYRGCLALLREPRLTAQHTQQSVERVRRQFVNCLFGCVGRPSSSFFVSTDNVFRQLNSGQTNQSGQINQLCPAP